MRDRAEPVKGAGFVGQGQAREACGVVVDMIRQKKMAGRALLLTGDSLTTQISPALAHFCRSCLEMTLPAIVPLKPAKMSFISLCHYWQRMLPSTRDWTVHEIHIISSETLPRPRPRPNPLKIPHLYLHLS